MPAGSMPETHYLTRALKNLESFVVSPAQTSDVIYELGI